MGRPRVKLVLAIVIGAALGYGVGVGQGTVVRPPLVVGQDAAYPSSDARVQLDDVGGRVLDIRPTSGDTKLLLVFYPGGFVRPQAYEWLGHALPNQGVETVIPEMPVDLAVLGIDRADALIDHYAQGRPVVLAGHSLGGAMAASYAAKHPDRLRGLLLMGAYPANDTSLASASFKALSLLAERDNVAKPDAVRGGLARLPQGSELVLVPGAVHAFFGRYGPQAGDGVPTVARADAEASIVAAVGPYLDAVAP
jgi:Alpha/beta hydrolase family